MTQPKNPRFNKKSSAFDKRQNLYTAAVHEIFKVCNKEAASLALSTGYDGSKPFSFKNFPATKKKIQQLQGILALNIKSLVINGTTVEFENSNLVIDKMVQSIFKQYGKKGDIHEFRKHVPQFFEHNNKALATFQQRTQNGMNLSQRCWILSEEYKSGLEAAVSVGIEKGTSAITLSKQISKYLVDFPKLKKNYTAKFGKANNVVDCEYRAVRLARTEINMAYRTAEQNRWKQLDFVVGYEVKRSATEYDCPVCDALMGKYPTSFKFVGWHPNCYDDKSEVYTKEGWKFFKDVKNDDLILSINPNTFDLEYSNILLNISRQHIGKMVHFFNRSYSQFVTPEHEVLHLSKNALNTFKRTTADECGKTQLIYRSSKWKGIFFPTVTIGCNVIDIRSFAEFMGYWLADGSLGHKYEISIAQQETNKQSMILSGIQRMGFNARHNAGKIKFNNKDFFEYLQQFGKRNTKFIPDEIKNSTPEIIQIFLDAFISCDGYIRPQIAFIGSKGSLCIPKNNKRTYFTTSKRLADDIGELILKIGKRPSFRVQNNKGKEHQFKNGIYTINFDTIVISECNSITATQYKKEYVDYNGMVYDLTLAKNNTMYIRRNGKCFWGSNCRCYTVPILKTPEEMRADTQKILSGKKTNDDSVNKITDVPQNFKDWVMLNEDRINAAKDKGTLPYFVRDNEKYFPHMRITDAAVKGVKEAQVFSEKLAMQARANVYGNAEVKISEKVLYRGDIRDKGDVFHDTDDVMDYKIDGEAKNKAGFHFFTDSKEYARDYATEQMNQMRGEIQTNILTTVKTDKGLYILDLDKMSLKEQMEFHRSLFDYGINNMQYKQDLICQYKGDFTQKSIDKFFGYSTNGKILNSGQMYSDGDTGVLFKQWLRDNGFDGYAFTMFKDKEYALLNKDMFSVVERKNLSKL